MTVTIVFLPFHSCCCRFTTHVDNDSLCPQNGGGIYGRDGSGYQCDCGVREEMLRCYGVMGWLKFSDPESENS